MILLVVHFNHSIYINLLLHVIYLATIYTPSLKRSEDKNYLHKTIHECLNLVTMSSPIIIQI